MTLIKSESLDYRGDLSQTIRDQVVGLLPDSKYLSHLFQSEAEQNAVLPHLQRTLIEPLEEFLGRPSKIIRAALVHSGFEAALSRHLDHSRSPRAQADLQLCSQVIELLHAGSLIIDDLQDESQTRRGKPCFHRIYGRTLSVTAGNWLYIWPLKVIQQLDCSEERIRKMQEAYYHALEAAHYGQALDVSVRVDELEQEKVSPLCQWVTRHKTGALTVLALELGAILAGGDDELLGRMQRFGLEFGSLLQNYDDLGNMLGHQEPAKQFEDLIHRRPSWVWALVADHFSAEAFADFCDVIQFLPQQSEALFEWISKENFVEKAAAIMEERQEKLKQMVLDEVELDDGNIQKVLIELSERLSHVYTKVLKENSSYR